MQTMEFRLKGEHVALCDLLKLCGVADSGGQGKMMVAEGAVKVDGKQYDSVVHVATLSFTVER